MHEVCEVETHYSADLSSELQCWLLMFSAFGISADLSHLIIIIHNGPFDCIYTTFWRGEIINIINILRCRHPAAGVAHEEPKAEGAGGQRPHGGPAPTDD